MTVGDSYIFFFSSPWPAWPGLSCVYTNATVTLSEVRSDRRTIHGLFIYTLFLAPPQVVSPPMHLLINVFAISCFLYLLVVFRDHRRRGGLPYPPGPPSRPIIRNLLDFPKDVPWSAYAKMSKEYGMRICPCQWDTVSPKLKPAFQGDVICLRAFSQVVVVLCSLSSIKDLLEKRGEIYSDRPFLPILEMYILWLAFRSATMLIIHPLSPLGRT